jgi:NosR/NirI family nitrous oxide reductase transcriptional regulator
VTTAEATRAPPAEPSRFSPARLQRWIESVLSSGNGDMRRPQIGKGNESSVKGLHIIGDLAGAPVIKLAMAQGVEVIDYLASLPEMRRDVKGGADVLDVLIVGAGAAGLNAALAAKDKGLRAVVLEKEKIANTIENFPEGKWVYAEPDATPPKGKLWLDGAQKEDLVARWHQIVQQSGIDVRIEEPLTKLERRDGLFVATTAKATYRARKIVLATGQRGNPRKLNVPGEGQERVYHRLYSPRKYHDESILVVGGGNSAIEAALTLSERNKVVLAHRGGEFGRVFKDNQRKLDEAVAAGRIEVVFYCRVKEFGKGEATLVVERGAQKEERKVKSDHAFVLVGAELPVAFLKSLGIKLENEWEGTPWRALGLLLLLLFGLSWFAAKPGLGGSPRFTFFGLSWLAQTFLSNTWIGNHLHVGDGTGVWIGFVPWQAGAALALLGLAGLLFTGIKGDRFAWLGLSFWIWYSIYGIKFGKGDEFWPYQGYGYKSLSFADRPWSFWYTVIYTSLMTVFGLRAMKRWGLDRKDRFQVWRYASLLAFQWVFFFLVPEFLFQWAVKYQWVGHALASDPQFADQAWRSYGIVYAWPLFFYSFFYQPSQIWVVWGVLLTFVVIPLFVLFQGKRYCSWICGCGGLAETFGDRWRHLAPKGRTSLQWEKMGLYVLVGAFVVTVLMFLRDGFHLLALGFGGNYSRYNGAAELGMRLYRVCADCWLVGILPVTLYPFLGGKVWCRYWCPLAKLMELTSRWFAKKGVSRFRIASNDKCIACGECSRNCQVGIPVMQYALKQDVLDNRTSSCIGCGICVTVCPMDTLSFGRAAKAGEKALPVAAAPH